MIHLRMRPSEHPDASTEQKPPMYASVAFLLLCGWSLSSCTGTEDAYEGYPVPVLPPPPQPIIVHCREAARGGILPARRDEIPADYDSFRSSRMYRLTFNTWVNDELLNRPGAEKTIVIELGNQRGQCLVDGQVAMDFPVCTGTSHHGTPTGNFRITEKDVHHYSNLYHCPMPYFMRLTNDGIGLHVGDVFRVPASHGCIRMTHEACTALFRTLPHGTRVCIRE